MALSKANYDVKLSSYKMHNKSRGIALIINIDKYDSNPKEKEQKERVWSKKDVENLTNLLNYLEFNVIPCYNYTKAQIVKVLQEQKDNLNHTTSDCFLLVVMSHGNKDYIVTSDNQEIHLKNIMEIIKSCTFLYNKPKIFLFQACRGDKDMRPCSSKSIRSEGTERMSDPGIVSSYDNNPADETTGFTIIEKEIDFLVFYSTLKDHRAYANANDEGTIFITSFCNVFKNAYKNLESDKHLSLSDMITEINNRVQREKLQVSIANGTMGKKLYFWPKYVISLFVYFRNFLDCCEYLNNLTFLKF